MPGALKHPPPKVYNEQARKLLEAVVSGAVAFYTWAMKRWKEQGE